MARWIEHRQDQQAQRIIRNREREKEHHPTSLAKEVFEATLPGGALASPRHALSDPETQLLRNPLVAGEGKIRLRHRRDGPGEEQQRVIKDEAGEPGTSVGHQSWMVFSGWVLTRRRPLFGRDGLVAGRMAVTFTSAFVVGTLAVGYSSGGAAPYAAFAMGLVLLAVAVAALVRARRNVARLTTRREPLERELGMHMR